jgi:NADH:ubiquinone reductase (non-electrogenic)
MAYVGDSKAAIDTQKSVGGKDSTLGLYGGFAFLLWRSVYITKQVSFRNRVLILFDWLKTRVFGRDLSMF